MPAQSSETNETLAFSDPYVAVNNVSLSFPVGAMSTLFKFPYTRLITLKQESPGHPTPSILCEHPGYKSYTVIVIQFLFLYLSIASD